MWVTYLLIYILNYLLTYLLTYLLSYLHTYLLSYSLTPWSRVLLENPIGSQLHKKFLTFYGTQRFITAFRSARHLSLSWAQYTVLTYVGKHVLIYKPAHRFCMTAILLYCKNILWQKLHIFESIMWQNFRIYMKQLLCTIEIYVPAVMVLLTAENMRKKCGMVASSGMILLQSSMKIWQVAQKLVLGVVDLLVDA